LSSEAESVEADAWAISLIVGGDFEEALVEFNDFFRVFKGSLCGKC